MTPTSTSTPFLVLPAGPTSGTETISELTALETSRNGNELRTVTRAHPRLAYAADWLLLSAQSDSLLDPIRAGSRAQIPLIPHEGIPTPSGFLFDVRLPAGPCAIAAAPRTRDALAPLTYLTGSATNPTPSTTLIATPTAPDPTATHSRAFYLIDCAPLPDALTLTHRTAGVRSVSASFETTDAVAPTYPLDLPIDAPTGRVIMPWAPVGGPQGWQDSTAFNYNKFDAGHLTTHELRYAKQTSTYEFAVTGRPEVTRFRNFILSRRGRAHPFLWQSPTDPAPRLYRLAEDTTTLRYTTPRFLQCSLALTALE